MSNKLIAKDIFLDGLESSLPKNFISKQCHFDGETLSIADDSYRVSDYKNIYVFGSGKAAYTMALEIEKLLKSKIYKGVIVATTTENRLEKIEVCEGSHPLPTQKSLSSAKKLMEMMQECDEDDLYIYLLSGGSSALIELPVEPITLEEFQETTEFMLYNGLDIKAINSVRKHISQIKGGRLAQTCKAKGVVLVLSDIIDNDLYSIGSAPLYADSSTYSDAKDVLASEDIFYSLANSVQEVLERGQCGLLDETPKFQSDRVKHYILASNSLALESAARSARERGFSCRVITEAMQGDVVKMVDTMLDVVESSQEQVIIFGGECTVKVDGDGKGGRNQHATALMLKEIGLRELDICFLSAGTDGIDGNTDAAGAVVDRDDSRSVDVSRVEKYINNFDTYHLLKEINTLIVTGASGTNVIDIAIVIKGE